MHSIDYFDCSASFRTSCATTAKPFPCSPALAALIEAFNADKLYFLSKKEFISPTLGCALLSVRPFETLEHFLKRYFTNPFILQCFMRYATYIGSSPYKTPATFAMIAYLELVEGVLCTGWNRSYC